MPELPEVEVVRRGLADHVLKRRIAEVWVGHPRSVRRHLAGPADFAARLTGRTITAACRRGKYLWLELDTATPGDVGTATPGDVGTATPGDVGTATPGDVGTATPGDVGTATPGDVGSATPGDVGSATPGDIGSATPGDIGTAGPGEDALLAHLGMSGQLLIASPGTPDPKHLHIRFRFDDDGPELRFVDQRTFGGLSVHPLAEAADGGLLPEPIAHIARDPMDPEFSLDAAVAAIRKRRTEIKRALLDQTVVSGIGNIYADEALWRARLHWARPTDKLTRPQVRAVLTEAAAVMEAALAQGGTSFDSLYVNVNGASGYFDRSLDAYGRAGEPCRRCGTPIIREPFMNRSSFSCPRCQPRPRSRRSARTR